MPRWPDHAGLEVTRLDGFSADGPPSDDAACTFTLEFDAAPAEPGEEVALAFDGIATSYVVRLNGETILEGSSMFAAAEVDVGARLRDGANVLEIQCLALRDVLAQVPRRPRQRWRTKVVGDGGLRFVRTAILGRAPGFAPGPPIVGPWRPVWLVRRRGVAVQDVALRPRMEGEDGVLALRLRLRSVAQAALPAHAEVVVGAHRAPLAIEADGWAAGTLRLPAVERWWPHTHGTPVLHDVVLVLDGATEVDLGRTGFRALTPGADHDVECDALALAVNGVPVFARGAVWTPVPEGELRATLTTVRDGGMNLVRIAGTGVYEDAAFHDLCDELGLLVWQDFMFANFDYPIEDTGFRAAVEEEARAALAVVAGRPSLAVLCGNSEVEQQAAMFGVAAGPDGVARGALFGELLPRLAREAGAEVPYVPSAPCGGALPFHPDEGVANYFGVGGYRRPLEDARRAGVRFASECLAFANLPDGPVADGEGVHRDAGADWDFADVRDHYLATQYGVDVPALRAADRDRYLALGRQVTGEVMAATFGEWRRGASPTAGAIVLWLRDLRAGAGWGVLDHAGAPKVAFAHLRRALAPQAVWMVDEGMNGVDVHVANDGPEALEAELHVALLAGGAHAVAEARAEIAVAPHGTEHHNVEGLLGRFADAGYAYRFGPPAHDAIVATLRTTDGTILAQATHFPTGPPLEPTTFTLTAIAMQSRCAKGDSPHPATIWGLSPARDVLGTVPAARASVAAPRRNGDCPQVVVTLATDRLAWGVRISAPGFVPVDDAFDLVPGAERSVALWPAGDAVWAGGSVTALNLIGEAPIVRADVRD
ncbi:MAG: glycoside hydrolase family 2 protein [Conexibacter sp.]|nr:glycoside hydrolase family 2 protein [Conexibacter sp.]